MNDQECTEVYRELLARLERQQARWLTEEIKAIVRRGRVAEERVSSRERYATRVPLLPHERLCVALRMVLNSLSVMVVEEEVCAELGTDNILVIADSADEDAEFLDSDPTMKIRRQARKPENRNGLMPLAFLLGELEKEASSRRALEDS